MTANVKSVAVTPSVNGECTPKPPENGRFSDRLSEAMGRTSLRAAARKAGVAHATLRQYLDGNSEPTRPVLLRLAAAFGVSLSWLAAGIGPKNPERAPAAGHIPVLGLAECGLRGWYSETPLAVNAAAPPNLSDGKVFGVMATGRSMVPAGIYPGFLCLCDEAVEPAPGDRVFFERSDGTASIKVFNRRTDGWLSVNGWLEPDETGSQARYSEDIKSSEVCRLAPIIYVKLKL